MANKITFHSCGWCRAKLSYVYNGKTYSRMTGIYDTDMDCVVAHACPDCGALEDVSLGEILMIADPKAFKEV